MTRLFFKTFLATCLLLLVLFLGVKVVKVLWSSREPETLHIDSSLPPPAVRVQIEGYTAFVPPGPERLPDVPKDLLRSVREGTKLVTGLHLDKKKCVPGQSLSKEASTTWRRCLGDYLVAAVDETGGMQVVEVYGGKSDFPMGFSVTCERDGACDGGVNPPFIISSPPGWTAVAVRTAVYGKGPDGIDAAVYVPYSTRLNNPELRQAGLEYLRKAVLGASYEVLAKDIESNYVPGARITDFGTPDHVIALILTEQMWSDTGFAGGADLERLDMLDRALVTLGLNRWRSYQYTKSWADARGIGQIVGTPYKAIRKQYPRLDLPEDDVWGRKDHHNAIKVMIAHTDAEWWTFMGNEEKAHRAHLLGNTWDRQLVFAAGYNANVATVHRAIHTCGESWREESCTELPVETRLYLIKYEWIYQVLFDEEFRARVESTVWPQILETDQVAQAEYARRHATADAQATN
ncbi:hypothetical protein HQ487_02565 [Candidatus Uhrbacteria bacterium]|nr:hypothetical protein [Candidatus Uhrbacteria bacterium]